MMKLTAAIATMFIGGILYVLARDESLTMFHWFAAAGLQEEVRATRSLAAPYIITLPRWIFLSLPQALWYFSGLLSFECIWGLSAAASRQRRMWMLAFSGMALGLEVGQYFRWIPGRFDPLDLTLLVVALGAFAVTGFAERLWLRTTTA